MNENVKKKEQTRALTGTILSLSLLTVMAGAAVAPALGVIKQYFSGSSPLLVQMIISTPAIFIVLTDLVFPRLCKVFSAKALVLSGLILYSAGGCLAGACSRIILLLLTRALVGIGVGMIMPLSTGLLSYYFPPQKQARLMGYSSAMNQMGGVIATLLAGLLAGISWRLSFMVYLLGFLSFVLCLVFLPNDKIHSAAAAGESPAEKSEKNPAAAAGENPARKSGKPPAEAAGKKRGSETGKKAGGALFILKKYYLYIGAMFLLMTIFFIYPANFALETAAEGVIPQQYVAVIMAMMDFIAFFGGLLFVRVNTILRSGTRLLAPVLFLMGYLLLALVGGWTGTLAGSVCIGFANGAGIPFIIAEVSLREGKAAATTVMPLISAALYLAQFLSPVIMAAVTAAFGGTVEHLPYWSAAVLSVLFCLWSWRIRPAKD